MKEKKTRLAVAQYSSFPKPDFEPQNARADFKGKHSVCVLAVGDNEAKNTESIAMKVPHIIIENYLRRPSLKTEAMDKIMEFANNGVMVSQTPEYPVICSVGALFIQGGQFAWAAAGDVIVLHFLDGQLLHKSTTAPRSACGSGGSFAPSIQEATNFGEGENSFMICSGSIAKYITVAEIENALSQADDADEWLRSIKTMYEDRCQGEPCSILTVFTPQKRKRAPKKVIVIIAILLVLAVGAFFGLGAMRRRTDGPNGGPNGGPMEPTRPPFGSESNPGQQPTRPPFGPGAGGPGAPEPMEPTQPPFDSSMTPGVQPTKPPYGTEMTLPAPDPAQMPEGQTMPEGDQDTAQEGAIDAHSIGAEDNSEIL